MRCGLLGERLIHSYSPRLHAMLGEYSYDLFEIAPDGLDGFIRGGNFDALNVTIPYKRAVMPYCAELSERARGIGSVNTILRRADGSLYGDNTDAAGFEAMLTRLSCGVSGKKALVLGNGGASRTVQYVLKQRGADVTVISRGGPDNYLNLDRHRDARIIVNATPVGMYPNTESRIVDLGIFDELEAIFDLIYNPARTALLEQAEALGIPCLGGLTMLVEQARAASELFTGEAVPRDRADDILRTLESETRNIALIGMPGCGKTAVAQALSRLTGRGLVDCDAVFTERFGVSPAEFLENNPEAEFRRLESGLLREFGILSGRILSTGGGCVTVPENRSYLRRNSVVVFIERPLESLSRLGRPLSMREPLETMYARRLPLYRQFADITISNDATVEDAARRITERIHEVSYH